MNHDMFDSAEAILQKRLNELPGQEQATMKEAGFNSVWKPFLDEFFQNGFHDTVKQASLLNKQASADPFIQGQNEAIGHIDAIAQEPYFAGWYSFVKEAHDAHSRGESLEIFCKEASAGIILDDLDEPQREAARGFLAASETVLESDQDLVKIAWNGPINEMENNEMNAFELGKEAALEDICDMVDHGAGMADCLEVIDDTVNTELDKYASAEDVDFRLGVESFCYDFLKEAADLYGEYDTSGVDDYDLIEHVVIKTAGADVHIEDMEEEEFAKIAELVLEHANPEWVMDKVAQNSIYRDVRDSGYGRLKALKAQMRSQTGKDEAKQMAKDFAKKHRGKAGIGAGVASGLAATELNRRRKKKKEEKGQKKSASLNDPQVQAALEVLDDAGLLDD